MDYSTGKPNIFNFATTELSQDAFLCWLVSWLNYSETDPQMYNCAREFVAMLYNRYHDEIEKDNKNIQPDHAIGLIETKGKFILQQYNKIDAYFRVNIDNKDVSFIIEDKTHTTYHSNQLDRYKKIIKTDKIHEDETIMIYFKTGYPYERDRKVIKHGYYPLFYDEWWRFLEKQRSITDPFFTAYREYFYKKFFHFYENELRRLDSYRGYETFQYDFTQYEFIRKIRECCPESKGKSSIELGKNRSGTPWSQYYFITFPNMYGPKTEWVFYRVDWKKPPKGKEEKSGYYLSIRQYANIKIKNQSKEDELFLDKKMDRLKQYSQIFNECLIEYIKFETKITKGKKESEIACLHFDPEINTINSVLKHISSFHTQFVSKILKSNL